MDISQLCLNFKDLSRKIGSANTFFLVIFPVTAVERYISLALRTEIMKRCNLNKCLFFCSIHLSVIYIYIHTTHLDFIWNYVWKAYWWQVKCHRKLGVKGKAAKMAYIYIYIYIFFKWYSRVLEDVNFQTRRFYKIKMCFNGHSLLWWPSWIF